MRTADQQLSAMVGSWRLLWYRALFCDTQEEIEPFGPNPPGFMVLGADGRVMFLFMSKERALPQGDADKARLLDSLTAYTGRMRVDGPGRIITSVDLAWHPAFGGEQTRFFRLEGERLRIWTP